MGFDRFNFDPENGAILAFREDDQAFVALADQIRTFSDLPDPTAALEVNHVIDALDRAWDANRNLFRKVTPRARVIDGTSGMAMELTHADRRRLHSIIDKHHRQYFASHPSPRQKDNLIDALGPEVAARLVKGALDKNQIN